MTHGQPQLASSGRTRYVSFSYCISIVVLTFKRSSKPVAVGPEDSVFVKGLPYTLLTLVAGWWGLPFGPIFTLWALYDNLTGGTEVG